LKYSYLSPFYGRPDYTFYKLPMQELEGNFRS